MKKKNGGISRYIRPEDFPICRAELMTLEELETIMAKDTQGEVVGQVRREGQV